MKTILVTGGAGFIGSHACKALANAGYLPLTVDNLERGHAQAVQWGPLEHADIRDEHAIRGIFEHWRPEAVLHFAAYAYVGESIIEPLKYYQTNVGGTSALLKACVTSGCNRIVYSSSCATYGIPVTLPIAENHPQQPINPYGFTKLVVERMLHDADSAHGIKHVTLRYFNAAGADPDGELGERHDPETHLIPLVLQAALGQRSSIKVFGNDYPTADGTCVRDYVHVSDLADAHVAALEWLFDESTSEIFQFRNGPGLLGRADRARSRTDYRQRHNGRIVRETPRGSADADQRPDQSYANARLETQISSCGGANQARLALAFLEFTITLRESAKQ